MMKSLMIARAWVLLIITVGLSLTNNVVSGVRHSHSVRATPQQAAVVEGQPPPDQVYTSKQKDKKSSEEEESSSEQSKEEPDTSTSVNREQDDMAVGQPDRGEYIHGEQMYNLSPFDRKCEQAGYGRYIFDEDRYDLQNWGENFGQPKPDFSQKCKSADVNPRGMYTSHLETCTFSFHSSKEDEKSQNKYKLSTEACSNEENQMDKDLDLDQYVVKWPDECVGDFARCYNIKLDEKILLRTMCKYGWTSFPEGATHVSVDCTADKQEKAKRVKEGKAFSDYPENDKYMKHEQRKQREYLAVIVMISTLCMFSGFILFMLTYRYFFRPYLATLKKSRSDPELQSLNSGASPSGKTV